MLEIPAPEERVACLRISLRARTARKPNFQFRPSWMGTRLHWSAALPAQFCERGRL